MNDQQQGFSLSFLDVLLSCLGGVALLLVLFAAIGKHPTAGEPVKYFLRVEIVEPADGYEIQDEIHLFLARGMKPSSLNSEVYQFEEIRYLGDSDEMDRGGLRLSWLTAPTKSYVVRIESEAGDSTSQKPSDLYLGIWLRRLNPKVAGDAEGNAYADRLKDKQDSGGIDKQDSGGIKLRITWGDQTIGPDVLHLKAENQYEVVANLDLGTIVNKNLSVNWRDPRHDPPTTNRQLEPDKNHLFWSDFDSESGWGNMPAGDGKSIRIRVAGRMSPGVQNAMKRLRTEESSIWKHPPEQRYVAVGPRGVCARDGNQLWMWFRKPHWAHLEKLWFDATSMDFHLIDNERTQQMVKEIKQRLPSNHGLADRFLMERLADAIAGGLQGNTASPVTKQDPLIWLRTSKAD